MDFIKNVKEVIENEEKYTAYEIEKATGISRGTIGRYRNGKADFMKMSLEAAKKLNDFVLSQFENQSDMDRIKAYYQLRDRNANGMDYTSNRIELTNPVSGQKINIDANMPEITFTFDGTQPPVVISGKELYKQFLDLTDDDICYMDHKYGLRTKTYLDTIKSNNGLLEVMTDWKDADFVESHKEMLIGTGEFGADETIEIGQVTDGRWCITIEVPAGPENSYTQKYYFNQKPTTYSFGIVRKVDQLETDFITRKINEQYECYDCGKWVHWLDGDGSFDDKVNALYSRKCADCVHG